MSRLHDTECNSVPRLGASRVLLLKDFPESYVGRYVYVHPPMRGGPGKDCRDLYLSKGGTRQHMIQHRERGEIARGPIRVARYKRRFERGEQGKVKLTRVDAAADSEVGVQGRWTRLQLPMTCNDPTRSNCR